MNRIIKTKYTYLFLLLSASAILRIYLVLNGGQLYFADEYRYGRSINLVYSLARGEWKSAAEQLLNAADHTGFIFVGIPAVPLQYIARLFWNIRPENSMWIAALFLSLSSLISIYLIYRICVQAGGTETEGRIAATLLASTTSFAYYARHLVPYDVSIALLLTSVLLAIQDGPTGRRSFLCGLSAGLGFFVYNGYWALTLIAILVHMTWATTDPSKFFRKGSWAVLGALSPVLLFTILCKATGQASFLHGMFLFSKTIGYQGDFSEGWKIPFLYLWHSEHGLAVLYFISLGSITLLIATKKANKRMIYWLGVIVLIWFFLSLLSTGLSKLLVYARTTRQMIPFICLGSAVMVNQWWESLRLRQMRNFIVLALLFQVSYNLRIPITQIYPREFAEKMSSLYHPISLVSTIQTNPLESVLTYPNINSSSQYIVTNPYLLWPLLAAKPIPPGKVLHQVPHPQQYLASQYEGLTAKERTLLRKTDISMKLIAYNKEEIP